MADEAELGQKGLVGIIALFLGAGSILLVRVIKALTISRNSAAKTDAELSEKLRAEFVERLQSLENQVKTLQSEQDRERAAKNQLLTSYTMLKADYQILVLNQHRLIAYMRTLSIDVPTGILIEIPSAADMPDLMIQTSDDAAKEPTIPPVARGGS